MWVLHVPEGVFDVILRPIGQDHFLIAPVVMVGEQDRLAQMGLHEPGQYGRVGMVVERR